MTFNEIVNAVAKDLNLTSKDSITRIGEHVNIKYRELVAKPWLQISRRGELSQPCTIGSRYLTFPVTKLYSIFDPAQNGQPLDEASFAEMRALTQVQTNSPSYYAIARASDQSITVFLDSTFDAAYSLSADAELRIVTLAGNQLPKFNEDFHDILYYGAKYLELMKLEKGELATEANNKFDKRLSDIQFHIAKTGYMDWRQGKDSQRSPGLINTTIT